MKAVLSLFLLQTLCVSYTTFAAPAKTEKEYRVDHAQADLDYHKAEKGTVEVVLRKAKRKVQLEKVRLERAEKLFKKNAIPLEQLEIAENNYDQAVLNVEMMESRLEETKAEIKGAEAKIGIVKTMKSGSHVPHDHHDSRNIRTRHDSWREDHNSLETLLQWKLLGFELPEV